MNNNKANSAFQHLVRLSKDAEAFGFAWPSYDMILDQIISECHEIKDALLKQESQNRLQEEVGDLLQAVIELFLFLDIELEPTMEKTAQKFDSRMKSVKDITKSRGLDNLKGQSIESLIEVWNEAKKATLTEERINR